MDRDATSAAINETSARNKKRWSDFSSRQQTAIVLGAIVELVMTTIALRDLARRPAGQVRGPKLLWLVTLFVQPVGPILYFRVGRRHPTRSGGR